MRISTVAFALTVGISAPAMAANLVTNGGFETNGGAGQLGFNTSAAGWSVTAPGASYAFLFPAAPATTSGTSADNGGANGEFGNVQLWGPGTGVNNGLTVSPNGGAFVAMDGGFNQGPISQSISGLTVGAHYALTFDWAASQQAGFDGDTTQHLEVTLGSETFDTPTSDLPNHGFDGWHEMTFIFTATDATELLSFLAAGAPDVPPFMLVDGVSLSQVPEPASLAILGAGVLGLGLQRLRRRR